MQPLGMGHGQVVIGTLLKVYIVQGNKIVQILSELVRSKVRLSAVDTFLGIQNYFLALTFPDIGFCTKNKAITVNWHISHQRAC